MNGLSDRRNTFAAVFAKHGAVEDADGKTAEARDQGKSEKTNDRDVCGRLEEMMEKRLEQNHDPVEEGNHAADGDSDNDGGQEETGVRVTLHKKDFREMDQLLTGRFQPALKTLHAVGKSVLLHFNV